MPEGAAVCGTLRDAERTPPVRRPARREARLFVVVIAGEFVQKLDRLD